MTDPAGIDIKRLDPRERAHWDDYVLSRPGATFFHRAGWEEVIRRAFGHRTHYLCARQAGEVVGVLPLVHVKSLLFGNALVSTPFCVYGGVVADTEAVREALEAAACRLAEESGVDHLEMRNTGPVNLDWKRKSLYVTFRKEIDADPEANLKAIPRKQRAMVRKGIKAGLESTIDGDVERLFRAYSESVRNLGTPVFPKKYFRILAEVFPGDCEVLTIAKDGQLIASVMSFYFRDQVLPYYGGGTSEARAVAGNDFMYWELMRRAAERGIKVFDYGRSKEGTGAYSFKKNWGFEPEPLYYEYYLVKGRDVPDINSLNPKYRLFIDAWKRLPLPVSQRLGPLLARSLG